MEQKKLVQTDSRLMLSMESTLVNAGVNMNMDAFISQVALKYNLQVNEIVSLVKTVYSDTKPIISNSTDFYDISRSEMRKQHQSFQNPVMEKNQHFVIFGLRLLTATLPLKAGSTTEVTLNINGVAVNYPINEVPVELLPFRAGLGTGYGSELLKGGKLNVGCGERKYLIDFPLTQFDSDSVNCPTVEHTYVRFEEPIVWRAEKKLGFNLQMSELTIDCFKQTIKTVTFARPELIGFQLA